MEVKEGVKNGMKGIGVEAVGGRKSQRGRGCAQEK